MKIIKKTIQSFLLTQIVLHTHIAFAETNTQFIKDIPVNRHLKHVKPQSEGPIMPGAGYSHDSQQVSPNQCYNSSEASHSGQQSVISINTAVSFEDLQNQLRLKVSGKGGYGLFSADAEAQYMRTIQDLSYSLSLNYYEYLYNTVNLKLNGLGQDALSQIGKDIYKNANTYFGILCGDDYISSYQQGALLLMGINIRFASHMDKQEFGAHIGGSWGNIISSSAEIQRIASEYHTKGTVIIQAFQKGGSPEQLSKILSKDAGGVYYALSCDLQHMDNCVKAASGLMNYAATDFPAQISFDTQKGLTPLGIGFISHDPIAEYGITPPPTLVTQQVVDDRNTLGNMLNENKYYQQKFNELLTGYPVPLDSDSDVIKKSQKLYKQVSDNIDLIMMPTDPDDGASKCYSHPTLCHELVGSIKSQSKPVSTGDLSYLDDFKSIASNFGFMYQSSSWFPVRKNYFMSISDNFGYFKGSMEITDTAISNINMIIVPSPDDMRWVNIVGNFQGSNNDYQGRLCITDETFCSNFGTHVSKNPFYVDAYQPGK